MKTIFKISGMSCAHCVRHVTEALEELEGVEGVNVSLEEATATVEHGENVTQAAMAEAIEEAGYEVNSF